MKKVILACCVVGLLATACDGGTTTGNGDEDGPPVAACTPSGTLLRIATTGPGEPNAFDEDCLAAPAGERFTIELDNLDDEQHNIAIFEGSDATGDNVFRGDILDGPAKKTFPVDPLEAGSYFFNCDVHPEEMTGTFVVE